MPMNTDPTRAEMVTAINADFGVYFPLESELPDSDTQEFSDRFEQEAALYWFANDHHSGQTSNLYSVLSTSKYKPGHAIRSIEQESEEAQDYYDCLEEHFTKPEPCFSLNERVYWNDPDQGLCSGYGKIAAVQENGDDFIYTVIKDDGGEVEATDVELYNTDTHAKLLMTQPLLDYVFEYVPTLDAVTGRRRLRDILDHLDPEQIIEITTEIQEDAEFLGMLEQQIEEDRSDN